MRFCHLGNLLDRFKFGKYHRMQAYLLCCHLPIRFLQKHASSNCDMHTYHYSPKSVRELKSIADVFNTNIFKHTQAKSTHLLPFVSHALVTKLQKTKTKAFMLYVNSIEKIIVDIMKKNG